MKKTVSIILIISLVLGLTLIILDQLAKSREGLNIPPRFNKVVVDLGEKARTGELLFTRELDAPSAVEFFMQSDAEGEKQVKIISESEILGTNNREIDFKIGMYTGSASTSGTYVMNAGKYSIYLTSEKTHGSIAIGYQETAKELSEFERLTKIHNGDLNNPPDGYEKIFATELAERSSKDEIIYTFTIDANQEIGLSVYTSADHGTVSVDLTGASSNYYGLVHPPYYRICDQLETTLPAGEYQFRLTCENADGQLYLFLRK